MGCKKHSEVDILRTQKFVCRCFVMIEELEVQNVKPWRVWNVQSLVKLCRRSRIFLVACFHNCALLYPMLILNVQGYKGVLIEKRMRYFVCTLNHDISPSYPFPSILIDIQDPPPESLLPSTTKHWQKFQQIKQAAAPNLLLESLSKR